jgi:GTPase
LGIRFLRHVERTRLLVHLIDTSDMAEMDPVKAYEIIEGELAAFSEALTEKPMIVVATKLDSTTDRTKLDELRNFCSKKGLEFHSISAPTGDGVKDLVRGMADALDRIPKEQFEDDEAGHADMAPVSEAEHVDISAYEDDEDTPGEDDPPVAENS